MASPPEQPQSDPHGYRVGSKPTYGNEALTDVKSRLEDLVFLKHGISVKNGQFNRIISELAVIAPRTKAPVLFMGPTGAGKSLPVRRLD